MIESERKSVSLCKTLNVAVASSMPVTEIESFYTCTVLWRLCSVRCLRMLCVVSHIVLYCTVLWIYIYCAGMQPWISSVHFKNIIPTRQQTTQTTYTQQNCTECWFHSSMVLRALRATILWVAARTHKRKNI